jgi:hypothetical protein
MKLVGICLFCACIFEIIIYFFGLPTDKKFTDHVAQSWEHLDTPGFRLRSGF